MGLRLQYSGFWVLLRWCFWVALFSLSQECSQSSHPQMDDGAAYLYLAIPRCKMTKLTRSDSLTRVHNGRICHYCATLLAEQVKPTHGLSSASEAKEPSPGVGF